MKIDDAIETTTRYFNDLIGTLIPGAILASGLFIMHVGPGLPMSLAAGIPKESGFLIALLLALLFAAGHGVLAVHNIAIELLRKLGVIRKDPDEHLAKRQSYALFQKLLSNKLKQSPLSQTEAGSTEKWNYHDLRNVALSVSSEGSSLGRRFMFISLLCNGTGTALLIMLADYLGCFFVSPSSLFQYASVWPAPIQILILSATSLAFFKRGESFYSRAMSTPFAVAVAEMALKTDDTDSADAVHK